MKETKEKKKEKKKTGERARPSLILRLSSGSGTHPHRGEVRLPEVDDRLPGFFVYLRTTIQLLRPSFYIVKLVGRGFRSLIPLPLFRVPVPKFGAKRRFAISRESCETFGIASRNKYILPSYVEIYIGDDVEEEAENIDYRKRS